MGPQRADLDGLEARRRPRGDRRRRERDGVSSSRWRTHSTRASPSCSRTASCATPAGPRKPGSRALTSRSGGSPRGAGIAAATRTIPRCRSIWSNASVRSGRGSSRSTGRMPATPGRGDQHLPVCRRRLAGDDAAGVAAGAAEGGLRAGLRPVRRHRRGGRAHRRQGGQERPRRGVRPGVSSSTPTPRSRRSDHGVDDGRRARAPHARAAGARQCAATLRCSGTLPRSDAGADRLASHQLGPPRPRHLRHHDGNDLAPARASAVRAVRIFGSITSKEPVPMNEHSTPRPASTLSMATPSAEPTGNSWRASATTR